MPMASLKEKVSAVRGRKLAGTAIFVLLKRQRTAASTVSRTFIGKLADSKMHLSAYYMIRARAGGLTEILSYLKARQADISSDYWVLSNDEYLKRSVML